jgi:hypothetical protein
VYVLPVNYLHHVCIVRFNLCECLYFFIGSVSIISHMHYDTLQATVRDRRNGSGCRLGMPEIFYKIQLVCSTVRYLYT